MFSWLKYALCNIVMILYVQLVEIYLALFEVTNYFIVYTSCTKYLRLYISREIKTFSCMCAVKNFALYCMHTVLNQYTMRNGCKC